MDPFPNNAGGRWLTAGVLPDMHVWHCGQRAAKRPSMQARQRMLLVIHNSSDV
jgi:hypothetical protein